jgi:hypothetical protein
MSDEIQRPDQNRQAVQNAEIDQEWADWLAPARRSLLCGAGAAAVGLVLGGAYAEEADGNPDFRPVVPPPDTGRSPWGYETRKEPTPRPPSLWPGGAKGLRSKPRPYTDIKSYLLHAVGEPFTASERLRVEAHRGKRCAGNREDLAQHEADREAGGVRSSGSSQKSGRR